MALIIPKNHQSKLSLYQTQVAIKKLKDYFERQLAKELELIRVTAPLFVTPESGLNDNLSGVEKPVSFYVNNSQEVQIVQSLAKWKRMALYNYNIHEYKGIYTDMNAIRKDEVIDNTHSYYVDQWDWEQVINMKDRNIDYLKKVVRKIYRALCNTNKYIINKFPQLSYLLPKDILFVTTQELEDLYPNHNPKEREYLICKEHGAVFVMKIGKKLKSGFIHDHRAPDYDDWDLNGDIIVYNKLLDCEFELSSMGIRVDGDTLYQQLTITNNLDRLNLDYHRLVLENKLPYTIGGGIGQSRLCMLFLEKVHIGEVQSSIWDKNMVKLCQVNNVILL